MSCESFVVDSPEVKTNSDQSYGQFRLEEKALCINPLLAFERAVVVGTCSYRYH